MRRETRNIGVIARQGAAVSAKFLGERGPNEFDLRVLRRFVAPEVYQQWVSFWRYLLQTDPNAFDKILAEQRANFPIVAGGTVADTGEDLLPDVASYLYSVLVGDGGYREALGLEEEAEATARLTDELAMEFETANILVTVKGGVEIVPPLVTYPIRTRPKLVGRTSVQYEPAFAQQNGRLFVIEPVDFTAKHKDRSRDHAGFTAFMFDDLRDNSKSTPVSPIALVRVTDELKEDTSVRTGLAMLASTADRVVNWLNPLERTAFLEERRRTALSTSA